MKKTAGIILAFVLMFTAPVFAETSIKAELDKTSITTDDTLTYKLTVTSSDKNIPEPEVPKFDNFIIISQAQSSTVSFVKSGIQTILVYAYILTVPHAGKFRIEPASIKIGNKAYSTQDFWVEVKQGQNVPEKSLPESGEPQYTL